MPRLIFVEQQIPRKGRVVETVRMVRDFNGNRLYVHSEKLAKYLGGSVGRYTTRGRFPQIETYIQLPLDVPEAELNARLADVPAHLLPSNYPQDPPPIDQLV